MEKNNSQSYRWINKKKMSMKLPALIAFLVVLAAIAIPISAAACSPGAPGCGWKDGDMLTYNQDNWGTVSTPASANLNNNFDAVYPGGVEIGIVGPSGFSALFTSASAVLNYQPSGGSPAPLDNDLQDPVSTSSGMFGGHVLAVQLDVDFSDAGHLNGGAGLHFGDLRVCGLTATPTFNGQTVRSVLDSLNQALGGAPTPFSYDDLAYLAASLTDSFESGSVSLFAQDHLVNGPCALQNTNIPEFPTVALPVIAVIGLMFLLHSRKGK